MNMKKKTLMVVAAGPFQVPGIRRAQSLGYRVIANDANPDAPGLKLADQGYHLDLQDIAGCIDVARKNSIVGVLTVAADAAVPTVSAVAAALDLPGVSLEAAQTAVDKSRMRECFDRCGVPSPKWRQCASLAEAEAAARELDWPVVVKPADNAGSRGVSLVRLAAELAESYKKAHEQSRRGSVMVEEFMPGVEISCELFVYRGEVFVLGLSDKIRTSPPCLLDTTVLFPSEHSKDIQERACEVASMAIRATAIDMATVHMELMVTNGEVKVVELAARGAGFRVFTDIVPWVTGIDTVEQLIRLSVGEQPDFSVTQSRAAVLRFPEVKPGVVTSVSGVESARALPGIFEASINVKPGDIVRPLTSGSDRAGHIIAFAETRAGAVALTRQAEQRICVRTEPMTQSKKVTRVS
jgi:biotin carboxylase